LQSISDAILAPDGSLYLTPGNQNVRKIGFDGVITTIVGTGNRTFAGDGGPASGASLASPSGLLFDEDGNRYVADSGNGRVRIVLAESNEIFTIAGDGSFSGRGQEGARASDVPLLWPDAMAFDRDGNLYVAELQGNLVRRIARDGSITTVAGDGFRTRAPQDEFGIGLPIGRYNGDGIPATESSLSRPTLIYIDGAGDLYITEWQNHRVRKVSNGIITTIAGHDGRGGPAVKAQIQSPWGVAIDRDRVLYIAEWERNRIHRVDPHSNVLTTIAGTAINGFAGDGAQRPMQGSVARKVSLSEMMGRCTSWILATAESGKLRQMA